MGQMLHYINPVPFVGAGYLCAAPRKKTEGSYNHFCSSDSHWSLPAKSHFCLHYCSDALSDTSSDDHLLNRYKGFFSWNLLLLDMLYVFIKIRLMVNKYNYISHTLFHLLNTLTYTPKYIFIII